jgi:hypothetical protein
MPALSSTYPDPAVGLPRGWTRAPSDRSGKRHLPWVGPPAPGAGVTAACPCWRTAGSPDDQRTLRAGARAGHALRPSAWGPGAGGARGSRRGVPRARRLRAPMGRRACGRAPSMPRGGAGRAVVRALAALRTPRCPPTSGGPPGAAAPRPAGPLPPPRSVHRERLPPDLLAPSPAAVLAILVAHDPEELHPYPGDGQRPAPQADAEYPGQ